MTTKAFRQGHVVSPIFGKSMLPTTQEQVRIRTAVAVMPMAVLNALNKRLARFGLVAEIKENRK